MLFLVCTRDCIITVSTPHTGAFKNIYIVLRIMWPIYYLLIGQRRSVSFRHWVTIYIAGKRQLLSLSFWHSIAVAKKWPADCLPYMVSILPRAAPGTINKSDVVHSVHLLVLDPSVWRCETVECYEKKNRFHQMGYCQIQFLLSWTGPTGRLFFRRTCPQQLVI